MRQRWSFVKNNPWQYFDCVVNKAYQSQQDWLLACLSRNKNSAYGLHYQFADIKNIADYQTLLPIVNYEALLPWIERLTREQQILFSEPIVAFERTGGSHSGGKLIPYSKTGLDDFRQALLAWLAELIITYQLESGCVYWSLSPVMARELEVVNGVPVGGGDVLYLGEENLTAFIELSAVPLSVAGIQTLQEWQIVTLYYLILRDDLCLISIWSPSFLLQLLEAINNHQQHLFSIFHDGAILAGHSLAADVAAAKRLEAYLNSLQTQVLWPNLKLISCWADASSTLLANVLRGRFPHAKMQPKGLLSTEAVITIPNGQGQHVLCLSSNFYEFLDQQGTVLLAHELLSQQSYEVIVTTNSGLYRYRTGDQVVCLGYQQEQPILQFIGRVGVVSDHVGEKLTESFVNQCLSNIQAQAMLAYDKAYGGYRLLVESAVAKTQQVISEVEEKLCHNPQYAYARQLNQLRKLTYRVIPKLGERYIGWCLSEGKLLGDIKLPSLLLTDWQQIFIE